jgi:hypothetical protein
VGARTLHVTFTRDPLFDSPIGRYDASNLQRWVVTRDDTGRALPMLAVRQVDEDALSVEILFSEPFANSPLITYTVEAEGIHSASGDLLVDPRELSFAGMPGVRAAVDQARPLLDLFNPQVDRDVLRGSLQVGTDGDYEKHGGVGLLRKLIVRRITTAIGEFYHLADTDYGAGLQPKQLFRPGDLVVLRTQLQNEIVKEPEVADSDVSLSLRASGRLDIRASIALRTGQNLTVEFPINPQLGPT